MKKFVKVPSKKEEGNRIVRLLVNKRKIPEGVDLIAGYIVENNKEEQALREAKIKQADAESIKRGIKIVAIIAAGLLTLQLITATKETKEIITTPITGVYYQIDAPSKVAWALANAYGQELMTNERNRSSEDEPTKWTTYNSSEQADREEKSIQNQSLYISLQEMISQNIEILQNPNSTQEEIVSAITNLKTATERIQIIYSEKKDEIEEYGAGFEKSAKVLPDNRTSGEIDIKNKIISDYNAEYGLSEENIIFINELYDRVKNGEEITIESINQELDGDYIITGESAKEVVSEQKLRGIRAIVEHMKNIFSRDKDQNTEER